MVCIYMKHSDGMVLSGKILYSFVYRSLETCILEPMMFTCSFVDFLIPQSMLV